MKKNTDIRNFFNLSTKQQEDLDKKKELEAKISKYSIYLIILISITKA